MNEDYKTLPQSNASQDRLPTLFQKLPVWSHLPERVSAFYAVHSLKF